MKTLIILATFWSTLSLANNSVDINSKINNVVVYQQGAQINRSGYYNVKKGISELHIKGISGQINPQTLQIIATGNVVILDSRYNVIYPAPKNNTNSSNQIPVKIQKDIHLLQDSLLDINFKLTAVQNELDVLNSEKRIIENNGTIKGVGKVNDSIPLLEAALTFYHKQMNKINAQLLNLSRTKLDLTKIQTRMNQRLTALNNYNQNNGLTPPGNEPPIHEIIVTVSANEYASGNLKVSYLVNGAGWTPLYDLRSNSSQDAIELTYKAQVYQNSGIDWENTRLSLSTNNPYTNKTKPTITPWYIDYYQNTVHRAVPQQSTKKEKDEITYYNMEDFAERDKLDEESVALSPEQFMTMIDQQIAVEYQIDLPYSIKSDNKKNMVFVKNSTIEANYINYAAPKLDKGVYLVAQITNLSELNILPGTATLFHEGTYLGNTYLNPESLSDTLDLSLGRNNQLIVERTLVKNATKEKIVGDNIVKTYTYQIEVRNTSKSTLSMKIQDQIPVSRNAKINIEALEISNAQLNEISGILTWKDKLKPGAKEKYEMTFSVTYPKTEPLNLALN